MKTILVIVICVTVLTSEVRGHRSRRFVGGQTASVAQFPYQVSLRHVATNLHFCGGSIIHEQFILTAAHCLFNKGRKDFYVAAGTNLVSSWRKLLWVERFSIHAHYDENKLINDIALIRLKKPFKFSKYIQKILLPAFASEPPVGVSMTTSGFGRIYYSIIDNSKILKYSNVTSISLPSCRKTIGKYIKMHYITNKHICTFDRHKGICHGDSGGPLVYEGELVGIVSWMLGKCVGQYPDIYVKVASYVKWIEHTKNKLILKSLLFDKPTIKLATTTTLTYPTELTEITTDAVVTTTKFAESMVELNESTTELNESTTMSAESITELSKSSTELPDSTTELNESTTMSAESITELSKSTTELPDSTSELNESTTMSAESITELSKSSTELPDSTSELNESTTPDDVFDYVWESNDAAK